MTDSNDLLTTLSQSSAVTVAIIGGFLMSRLVALLSERETIRRQMRDAEGRLKRLQQDYEPAHRHRLEWSQDYFKDLALDKIVEERDMDLDEIIEENVPRGSSVEEIRDFAYELKRRVEDSFGAITKRIRQDDTNDLDLDDLRGRGLGVPDADLDIYESVLYQVKDRLPSSNPLLLGVRLPPHIGNSGQRQIEARRFDDALKAELELAGQLSAAEAELERLWNELRFLGRPIGVISAVWMLAILSLTGIVAPVAVMAFGPEQLSWWLKTTLVALFMIGIAAVLGYVLWYAKRLDDL